MLDFLNRSTHFNFFVGLTFIVFGLLFLLSNYGFIPAVEWNKVWPVILIILGATFLVKGQVYKAKERPSNWL